MLEVELARTIGCAFARQGLAANADLQSKPTTAIAQHNSAGDETMTTLTIPIAGRPVTFTSEVPKEEGAYWWTLNADHPPQLRHITGLPWSFARGYFCPLCHTQERDEVRKVAKELAARLKIRQRDEFDRMALAAFEKMEDRS